MICPHCKNDVKSIINICPSCGCALYEKTDEKVILTKQEYICNKLLDLGINKYENNGEISKEDELFLKLKAMEIVKENNEVMKKQEKHLAIIRSILGFFTIITVIIIIMSIITIRKAAENSLLHSYERNIGIERFL